MPKKKKRRGSISGGTIFMLVLTVLVVLSTAAFLRMITGGNFAGRAADVFASFTFAEASPVPEKSVSRALTTKAPAQTEEKPERETPAPTMTPAPQAVSLRIAAAGTVYAPKAVRQTVEDGQGQYAFEPVFAGLTDVLAPADLAIVTLETMTAGSEKGYGNFNAPSSLLDALRACGVDLISLATERALEKDYSGLSITMQEITSRGLSYAGAYEEAAGVGRATVSSIGGVQVAVLAYTYGLSDEGQEKTGNDRRGLVPMLQTARMRSDIARARQEGAHLVIVLPHWGTKNKQATPEFVRSLAQEMAKAGADIILGTHPNVVQGIERIESVRADGLTYETLVCYSLGSLLTDARTEENTAGMAVTLPVTYDPASRRVQLGEEEVTPLYIARTKSGAQSAYRVVNAQDEAALSALDGTERQAAARAAARVNEMTAREAGQ